jgi:hypothetical protein
MAIVKDGINGPFNGKVGSVIGYQMMGKNVIKGLPKKSAKNKRGSVKQKASRSKFTQMQHFLRPILHFIQVGFNMEARGRQISAHNAAKSYNMLNAFNEESEIDYSKILVAYGNLPGVLSPSVQADDAGLHFSWTNNSDGYGPKANDQVMLLAYHPDEKIAKFMVSGARRNAERETLELWSGSRGNNYHTWIAFISDDRQQISMSTYLGEIVF